MHESVLKMIREQGLLLEKDVFDILNSFKEDRFAKEFLENVVRISGQKMITKSVLNKNFDYVRKFVNYLEEGQRDELNKVFVKLGLNLVGQAKKAEFVGERAKENQDYQLFYSTTKSEKKIGVDDFVTHFRTRYQQIQRILMQRPELTNLISINKIAGDRQSFSIIGMVIEKRQTKNGNLIISLEDLTGKISVLVKPDRKDAFLKASELVMDDIVAIKGSGSREILFAYDLFFPDAFLHNKVKFEEDYSIAIFSDIHCGSNKFLKKSFQKFISWLNSSDENAKKIRYMFIVGDNIDGVGVYPNQDANLEIKSTKEQYKELMEYLKQVPKRITMFMCPGQHDAVRLAEPQPPISRQYGNALYDLENLVLVSNPCTIKLKEKEKEFKVLMYHGDSIHDFIREIPELRTMKAHKCPAKALVHMLKRRHLFPMHSLAVYLPGFEVDPLVISEIPDIICSGEVHRLDVEVYNGILAMTGSCWQAQTAFEEKVGNVPDPCKVAVLNLKSREFKILDFTDEEELKEVMGK